MKNYNKDRVDRRRFYNRPLRLLLEERFYHQQWLVAPLTRERQVRLLSQQRQIVHQLMKPSQELNASDIFVQIKPSLKKKGESQQVKDPKVLTQLGIKNADDYILLIRENDETVTARNMNAHIKDVSSSSKKKRWIALATSPSSIWTGQ